MSLRYCQLCALPRAVRQRLQRQWKQSLAGVALLLTLGATPTWAAMILVAKNVPPDIKADKKCSLIEALINANADWQVQPDCMAGNGADTIALPTDSTQTLTAVDNNFNNNFNGPTGLPVISSVITIVGNGSTITRNPKAPAFRVLAINASGNLTLQDTRVSGGMAPPGNNGGGIANFDGQLTLERCTVSGNMMADNGGGVYSATVNTGTVTLRNSTVSGNTATIFGGGVYIDTRDTSTVQLENSTVSGNTAARGGGVWSNTRDTSTVTLKNSTVSGNTAVNSGGGVWSNTRDTSTVQLENSTVSKNTAATNGGGMVIDARATSTVQLMNSTMSDNTALKGDGGGVHSVTVNGGTVQLRQMLIAGNKAGGVGVEVNWVNLSGTFKVNASNLFGHSGLTTAAALSRNIILGASDITATSNGTKPNNLNAILNPNLLANGGPTLTHQLVLKSPAIDACTQVCPPPPTDQRGAIRPFDGDGDGKAVCDIGAVEFQVEEANQKNAKGNDSASVKNSDVKIVNRPFTTDADIDLSVATITLFEVLNTNVEGIGELVKGTEGRDILPLELFARRGNSANSATFESASNALGRGRPHFLMRIKNKGAGLFEFTLTVEQATISVLPELCTGNPRTIDLATSFTINDGALVPVLFESVQPWECEIGNDGSVIKLKLREIKLP